MNVEWPHHPAAPLLGKHPPEWKRGSWRDAGAPTFTGEPIVTAKRWQEGPCAPTEERVSRAGCRAVEHQPPVVKKGLLPHTATRMTPDEGTVLSATSPPREDPHGTTPPIRRVQTSTSRRQAVGPWLPGAGLGSPGGHPPRPFVPWHLLPSLASSPTVHASKTSAGTAHHTLRDRVLPTPNTFSRALFSSWNLRSLHPPPPRALLS